MAEAAYDVSEAQIRRELLSNHSQVRREFMNHFKAEIDELGAALYQAIARLRKFGERVGAKPDLRGAWVELSQHDSARVLVPCRRRYRPRT